MLKNLSIFIIGCLVLFLAAPPSVTYALSPSSQSLYRGIDVSRYQGAINFDAVADSGIEVVYIRTSLGSDYIDPYFEQNYLNARAAGLSVGFYHYVTARSVSQAQYQAKFFANVIEGKDFQCKLAMDFEDLGNLSVSEINEISLAFMQTMEEISGQGAIVYSNAYDAANLFQDPVTSYPLWIAEYGVSTPTSKVNWSSWTGWQHSDKGRIPGITGNVDLDYFTDQVFLDSSAQIGQAPQIPAPNLSTINYRVKSGDTLWSIAGLYHTSVSAITSENQLADPNRIYPGQTLRIRIADDNPSTQANTAYTVKQGDTLSSIASRNQTTVTKLVTINGISNPNRIYIGQILNLLGTVNSSSKDSLSDTYTVKRGDTLLGIASKYHTTVSILTAQNSLSNPNRIFPGQKLTISGKTITATLPAARTYTIKQGDTLSEIAGNFQTTISKLTTVNALKNPNRIFPGQMLKIPY